MTNVKRLELAPGVFLTAVQTSKFKSAALSATLLTPLSRETASANALIPYVLRRGTERLTDMGAVSAALDDLYGGTLEPVVRKKGETQCLGFVCGILDDAYTLNGEDVLEPAAGLLGEVLLRPYTQDGAFCPDYTAGEKSNLIDRIRAQMNEKRQYSVQRLTQLMCRGEAYGVDRYGDEAAVAAVTPQSLWAAYQDLLKTARVELYYCGSADIQRVEAALGKAFSDLPRNPDRTRLVCDVKAQAPREPQVVEEAMDVAQGKLAMGFRTGGVSVWEKEFPALMVFNAVYGGTTTSKLFMNVREKLSLCYFASSILEKMKGVMLVSSGIEFDKYRQAKEEIMAQLETCRKGRIEDWELVGAVRSIVSALTSTLDSQGRLEDFWLGQAVAGLTESPQALCARVETVTREDVVAVANRMELDTIYFLKGQGAEA